MKERATRELLTEFYKQRNVEVKSMSFSDTGVLVRFKRGFGPYNQTQIYHEWSLVDEIQRGVFSPAESTDERVAQSQEK